MSQHLGSSSGAKGRRQHQNSTDSVGGTKGTAASKEQPLSPTSHMPTTNQAGSIGGNIYKLVVNKADKLDAGLVT